jgi:glycosyltransferase involved in cell wall biosynthesis
MIRRDQKMIENGLTKFNDTLIYGFSKFIKEHNITDACLVMIDRKFSGDIDEAKKIIEAEGIEKYCIWIKGKTCEGFTKNELVDLYSYSNVVADSFDKIGWIGSIVVEGLACSRPVIHSINDKINNELYGWHPVLNAYTPSEVGEQIKKLYFNPELQKEQGNLGRKWVELFHSPENASKKYVEELKRLLG